MGELADDMVTGACCCLCGAYFEHPTCKSTLYRHDHPVVCWDCWDDMPKKDRKQYQRADTNTL